MQSVLVTGGAGFIGSHLCRRLLGDGARVVCIDNLSTGKERNLQTLLKEKRFRFVRQDVTEPFEIEGPIGSIYHLASPASPVEYLRMPLETLNAGSIGTRNILELAAAKKAKLLFASTSEVYGEPKEHPQSESYFGNVNPVGLRSVYSEAKRFAEALVMAYHRHAGLETRIVRIFNTYGPLMREDDGRVASNFITQALSGADLTVYGDGSQTRTFCYVDDLVEGLLLAVERGDCMPVNLGDEREISMLDFGKLVLRLSGSAAKIAFRPLPEDDPKVRRPDSSRARNLLGWVPKVDLEKGMARTLKYFRGQGADP
jgi:dTDP-glucose 4,6-dehydratase